MVQVLVVPTCFKLFPRRLSTRKLVNHSVPSSSFTADIVLLSKQRSASFLYRGLWTIDLIELICKYIFACFFFQETGTKGSPKIQRFVFEFSQRFYVFVRFFLKVVFTHTLWIQNGCVTYVKGTRACFIKQVKGNLRTLPEFA